MAKPRNRATEQEKEERIELLVGLKAAGYNSSKLITFACQQWNLHPRQAKRYLREAAQRETQLGLEPDEVVLGSLINRTRSIYSKAMMAGDFLLALKGILAETKARESFKKQNKTGAVPHYEKSVPHLAAIPEHELAAILTALESQGANPSS